jgi:AcrR family transcriptional regulator
MAKPTYHHGDLRRALIAAAVEAIGESGPTAVSLRDLARRAGVSHAAPTHHFRDKAGLLTAVAAEGYDLLASELAAARVGSGSFLDLGVAYVRFALAHRAHFEVMFRPDLYHPDDPVLAAARKRAGDALDAGVVQPADGGTQPIASAGEAREAGLAAWSLAHGFATLWLSGSLSDLGSDPGAAARVILRRLGPSDPP